MSEGGRVDFRRESWRKLYVRENLDHRAWPVLWRGLRDYLIRIARDDGTLLTSTRNPGEDLARAIGSHPDEVERVASGVETLIRDGYLSHTLGRLFIARYEEGQARTTSTERVRRHRAKRSESAPSETVSGTLQKRVTKHENETETTRPDPTRNDKPPCSPPRGKKRGHRLPDDWTSTRDMRDWARGLGLHGQVVDDESEKFRDHFLAAAGQTARKVRWDLAWKNWMRRVAERRGWNRNKGGRASEQEHQQRKKKERTEGQRLRRERSPEVTDIRARRVVVKRPPVVDADKLEAARRQNKEQQRSVFERMRDMTPEQRVALLEAEASAE